MPAPAAASPPARIADALVVTICDGFSLRQWQELGILAREWALYARIAPRYGSIVLLSYGDERDHAISASLDPAPMVVANSGGLDRPRYLADAPARVAELIPDAASVVVKTDQMMGGDAAMAVADHLRRSGRRVGLVARGGYPWSWFVAQDRGPESPEAAAAFAREGELCRAADVVVCTTESMRRDLAWAHRFSPAKAAVVPNYLPALPRVDPAAERSGRFTVLVAGRLDKQKRVDLAIGAVAASGACDVNLQIVGDGPLKGTLRDLAGTHGVEAEFRGVLPHDRLLREMASCDVFLQTSAYEGHPKTVLEAMAMGAPVVVADAPGLREPIEHDVTGLVCSADADVLGRAIARLATDGPMRSRLGAAAKEYARAAFSLDRIAALEAGAHTRALEASGSGATRPVGEVRWDPAFLAAEPTSAVDSFARSLQGYCARREPEDAVRVAMALDQRLDDIQNWETMRLCGGVHPKHRLTDYHAFFVDRIRRGERVLDLGCGYAQVARSIATRAGAHVTGVEIDPRNAAQARGMIERERLADRLRIIEGDLTAGPPAAIADERFDAIVMSNVLEHLDGRPAVLRRWVSGVSPRVVLIRVPAFDRNWKVPWKRELGLTYFCEHDHRIEYTEPVLREELAAAGLRTTEIVSRWGEYWAAAEPE